MWLATFVQRCVEHDELVDACVERLEASRPKHGEPSPIPVGTVATYGPGLAPLEYARLTGLVSRYAPTASGGSSAESTADSQMERGTLSDVPAPWQGGTTAPGSPAARAGTDATPTGTPTARDEEAPLPGVPVSPAPAPSPARGVVYPRHLPELKVQKLPKCVTALPL